MWLHPTCVPQIWCRQSPLGHAAAKQQLLASARRPALLRRGAPGRRSAETGFEREYLLGQAAGRKGEAAERAAFTARQKQGPILGLWTPPTAGLRAQPAFSCFPPEPAHRVLCFTRYNTEESDSERASGGRVAQRRGIGMSGAIDPTSIVRRSPQPQASRCALNPARLTLTT